MKSPGTGVRPLVVGVCGGSASGKTWLADRLAQRLSGAVRLSVDSFYHDRSHLPPGRRARLNFDHPRAIDWVALERCLSRLRAGKAAEIPHYDFETHARRRGTETVPTAPVIIVDGLWLFRRPSLRRLMDLRVFLECPARVRLQRRLERDVRERGRTPADVRRQFAAQVEPMHGRFVEPQARWASLRLPFPLPAQTLEQLAELITGSAGRPA